MKCQRCGCDVVLLVNGICPMCSWWLRPIPEPDPKTPELAAIRDAIDRACRVVTALSVEDGNWMEDSKMFVELNLSLEELCDLRARERALAAPAPEGQEGGERG